MEDRDLKTKYADFFDLHWDNSEVCSSLSLQVPQEIMLQLPTVVTCLMTNSIG